MSQTILQPGWSFAKSVPETIERPVIRQADVFLVSAARGKATLDRLWAKVVSEAKGEFLAADYLKKNDFRGHG